MFLMKWEKVVNEVYKGVAGFIGYSGIYFNIFLYVRVLL